MLKTQTTGSVLTVRSGELIGLLFASCVVIAALWLVYQAKSAKPLQTEFKQIQELLKTKQLVNLNAVLSQADLLGQPAETSPLADVFPEYQEQATAANLIVAHLADLKQAGGGFERVGGLTGIRVNRSEIDGQDELKFLRPRLGEARLLATRRPLKEWLKEMAKDDLTRLAAVRTVLARLNGVYASRDELAEPLKKIAELGGDTADEETEDPAVGQLTQELKTKLEQEYEQAKATEGNPPPGFLQRVSAKLLSQRRAQPKDLPLVSFSQLQRLKPHFIVRTPAEFRSALFVWGGLTLLVFYVIHLVWKLARFRGDQIILPVVHLLTGLGLAMMASLRDPLRDQLQCKSFAQGVLLGGGGLLAAQLAFHLLHRQAGRSLSARLNTYFPKISLLVRATARVFETLLAHLTAGLKTRFPQSYALSGFLIRPILESPAALIPLSLALSLGVLLFLFGSAPGEAGEQGVKVNLGGVQPVELIKLLVVIFLAGYFDALWKLIRDLNQRSETPFSVVLEKVGIPRLRYFLPVVCAMGLMLVFFFAVKDLGPALVLALTFLSLYFIVRSKPGLIIGGLGIFAGFVALGYTMQTPMTVYKRIQICFSPWGNGLPGGDQIAHSLWAFSTGGMTGMGLGLGDPVLIPAGHTDLILSSFGEELGFFGLAVIFILYAILIQRGFRAARSASNLYLFFLATGLTLLTVWQMLLIACGILGLFPLSGVVSPFLSFGKSSMVANFIIFGLLLSISATSRPDPITKPFHAPLKAIALALTALAVIIAARAGYIQVISSKAILLKEALAKSEDGHYFQHNPRLDVARRLLPMGTVYDRTGIPLASSDWQEIEKFSDQYRDLARNCSRSDERHYPFGDELFYLLGRTRKLDGGTSRYAHYLEDEYDDRLRGYQAAQTKVDVPVREYDELTETYFSSSKRLSQRDYSALLPLLLYRNNPDREEVKALLQRKRDVTLSLDVAYQLEVSKLLREGLRQAQQKQGGAVVLMAETGEVLASASYPLTPDGGAELDHARRGNEAPGSTFKVLTAIAAARKDPDLLKAHYDCRGEVRDRQGRVIIKKLKDHGPSGLIDFNTAMSKSSNAYFAQLGLAAGEQALVETARFFGIETNYDNEGPLKEPANLARAAFGQAGVRSNPLEMARVAATIANRGELPPLRFALDEPPAPSTKLINDSAAASIAEAMRKVVTEGTARMLNKSKLAGKTGTADTRGRKNNVWFIGFSPYDGASRIAFAVMIPRVEKGSGAVDAAPFAEKMVAAASAKPWLLQRRAP